jgi:hypothetical protein
MEIYLSFHDVYDAPKVTRYVLKSVHTKEICIYIALRLNWRWGKRSTHL